MRFSCNQTRRRLTDDQARERRKARFIGDLKGEIRQIANSKGMSLTDLACKAKRHKSAVTRALDPSTNIEAFTLFDLAEALGTEWRVALRPRDQDLTYVLNVTTHTTSHFKVSHAPAVSVNQNAQLRASSGTRITMNSSYVSEDT